MLQRHKNTPSVLLFICAALVGLIAQQAAGCLNNCSGKGHCDTKKNVCVCNTGYGGIDCSISAITLEPGHVLPNQVVAARQWIYYYTPDAGGQPNDQKGEFTWEVHTLTSGDVDIFVQKDRLPTRSDWKARNITNMPNFTVTTDRNFQGGFYVGIYCFSGHPTVTFTISVRTGADCPQMCNGHGQCMPHHKCKCLNDWTGETCNEFIKQLEFNKQVSSSVKANSWKYFRVHAIVQNTLRVIVNQTSATGDVDMYIRFGEPPTLTEFDLVEMTLEKNFYIDIQLDPQHFGFWVIGIYGISQTSFDIRYNQYSDCPNMCSLHGQCSTAGCTCSAGYSDTYCETKTADLRDGEIVKGYVSDAVWNWYTYTPKSTADMLIEVNQTGHAADQDCDLYAKRGSRPTESDWDARNISSDAKMTLRIPDAGFTKWHIGVFGFSACTYFISVASSTQCPPCGAHGTCSTKEGICVCQTGWTGQYCQKQIEQITNFSHPINGSLVPGRWDYYSVQGNPSRFLTVHLLELETTGAFWLFLNPKTPPTLIDYNTTLSDKESNTNHHGISTQVTTSDMWYIGVYGSPFALDTKSHPYKLQVWESPFRR